MRPYKRRSWVYQLRSNFEEILSYADEEIEQAIQIRAPGGDTSKNLRQFCLPFVDSHFNKIDIFSLDTQVSRRDIRIQLDFLNDHMDQTRVFSQ